MNTVIKVGAASALALAGVAAHASISAPSGGSSDAILFAEVLNAAGTQAVASYAGDTGLSINSLIGGLSSTPNTVLGSDANLAKLFAADAAGDTVEFAVLGGQFSGGVTPANLGKAGVSQFLTTTFNNSTSSLANDTSTTLTKFANLNADVALINSNSGNANSVEGPSPSTAGIWDVANTSGLAFWDGGATSNGNPIGSQQNLYYVTGQGSTPSTKVAYTLLGTASLTAGGLTLTGSGTPPPPVPLPAAVWLLGSGLLGLTGVARRKLKV